MSFHNPEARAKEERSCSPHPDAKDNVNFFHRVMQNTVWVNRDLTYCISDREFESVVNPESGRHENIEGIKEFKNATFVWEERGIRMTTVISFHNLSREFRVELCGIMNGLGSKGYVKHSLKEDMGYRRDKAVSNNQESFDAIFKRN